jgi:response regulator RpfG family c-di-GMP phosphodiesterase
VPDSDFSSLLHDSRILIVEDDEDTREALVRCLAAEGYENVECISDGQSAMRRIIEAMDKGEGFDLVILDLMLPGQMSGEDVCKSLSTTLDVPIVVLTAKADKDSQLELLRNLEIEDYFIKPVDMEIFLLKCERVLIRHLFSQQLAASTRRNQRLFLNILQVMAKVLEAKDPYTKFHSENVAKHARQIARKLGYSGERLELIQVAGILHDFGKIGITEGVLNKPGTLTEPEYQAVRRHPLIASTILEPIQELATIIKDIRHHHERYDGRGYPDGLSGEDIPLGARILCVADSYDAMTSARPYHESRSEEEAREELRRCSGSQFDPRVVETLIEVLDENTSRRERIVRLRQKLG